MTLSLLIASAAILFLTVLGLSVLLFGRDWIRFTVAAVVYRRF